MTVLSSAFNAQRDGSGGSRDRPSPKPTPLCVGDGFIICFSSVTANRASPALYSYQLCILLTLPSIIILHLLLHYIERSTPPPTHGCLKSHRIHQNTQPATMSSIRRMTPTDLFSLNLTNLDPLTENYDLGFYLNYLMRWPSLFSVVQDRREGIVGYSMDT